MNKVYSSSSSLIIYSLFDILCDALNSSQEPSVTCFLKRKIIYKIRAVEAFEEQNYSLEIRMLPLEALQFVS